MPGSAKRRCRHEQLVRQRDREALLGRSGLEHDPRDSAQLLFPIERSLLASRPHKLGGRNVNPKPCTPRGMQPERTWPKEGWQKGPRSDNSKSNKIFVGGIPHNCGETELREYFKKFGVVTEVVVIYDAEKQRPRGFGFITFEDEQSVDQAVNMHFHDIKLNFLSGLSLRTARASSRDSHVSVSGGVALFPTLSMAGQASPRPRGSKDMARKECGCGRDRRLVATDRPLREEETPATPTIHLLHHVHPSWRIPLSPGLPSGLRCPATVQFWLQDSISTIRSVCPSGGSSSTGHSQGSASGLPSASVSGCPGHEQAPDSSASLPLRSVCRLQAGLEWLWTGLLGPQPAAPLLRGPLRARVRGPPCQGQGASVLGSGPPPPAGGSGFGRGQYHNVQGFHPYRRQPQRRRLHGPDPDSKLVNS
ncbi:hypothetical protein P7K49_005441 [Saguinus oedipus]|uniref:RRM domain-containing protein n=1 Tax=Saguinus oedipus TaxID=9490 RepID=A0ABQ9WBX2_SAGOE|nr:hypothetical protein P7K49_005441 [Saguinus oedipus]